MDRVKTGIEGLDQLLFGGLLPGDAMLVSGAPGTGKTSLGMQYLYNGITKYQQPGLFITFEEFPQRIYRDAANYGWDFRALQDAGQLKVLFTSPEILQQDIVREEGLVSQMIRETKAQRVVVDSITHLQRGGDDDGRFRESLYGPGGPPTELALAAIMSFAVLLLGWLVFTRLERNFADVI